MRPRKKHTTQNDHEINRMLDAARKLPPPSREERMRVYKWLIRPDGSRG